MKILFRLTNSNSKSKWTCHWNWKTLILSACEYVIEIEKPLFMQGYEHPRFTMLTKKNMWKTKHAWIWKVKA